MKKLIVDTEQSPVEIFSTMGCLSGHEHLYIKLENEEIYDISIKNFFEYAQTGNLNNARPAKIFFNKERTNFKGDKHIQEKSNISPGSGVYSITYKPLDVSYIGSSSDVCRRWAEHKSHIKLTGGVDAGPCFGDHDVNNYEFKVLEYTPLYEEVEKNYIQTQVNINLKGVSKKFYKNPDTKQLKLLTDRPKWKLRKPNQTLINLEDRNIQVYDINNNWVKIKHVFKNDKYSSPYMMHIYYEEFGKKYKISATEDHPFFNGKDFTIASELKVGDFLYRADGMELPIVSIGYHWEMVDSYDIGTESGTFVGSDIKMHNCRTANGADINFNEEYYKESIKSVLENERFDSSRLMSAAQKDGRGNVAPATIILPTLAMEAKKKAKNNPEYIVDYFMDILEVAISDCKDELLERFEWICAQPSASAKFMYENNTMFGYKKDEGIQSALKHGTLAIGQLGMAECLQILIGTDQTEQRGLELAQRIETLFKKKCDEYKERYRLNFGVYYTPAENLCFTAMKKFKEKYGVIENVSNHDYFTNSIHVPVWKEVSPFEKIDIESKLTGYSSAGCITYIELEDSAKDNLEGLEQIVNYAMDNDIPYFALNLVLSNCKECDYNGYIPLSDDAKCPVCGSKDVVFLGRITGYLSTDIRHFNKGKQAETKDRFKHTKKLQNWNRYK